MVSADVIVCVILNRIEPWYADRDEAEVIGASHRLNHWIW